MGSPKTYRDPFGEDERIVVKVEEAGLLCAPQPTENPVRNVGLECTTCAWMDSDTLTFVHVCAAVCLTGM
jgi:hypothetical protein